MSFLPPSFPSLSTHSLTPHPRHSDKTQERTLHIALPYLLGIVGFIIAIATQNTAARYVSLFLMAQSYAGYVCALAWIPNTIPRPPSKRAVALALINAVTQLGNISGSYMFPDPWGEWGLWLD